MAGFKITLSAFPVGYIDEEIRGASDLQSYNQSLADCKNFYLPYFGGAYLRPGTKFIGFAKNGYQETINSYAVTFLDEESFQLEFGANYLRINNFDRLGVKDFDTVFSEDDVRLLTFDQYKNTVWIGSPKGIFNLIYRGKNGEGAFQFAFEGPLEFSYAPIIYRNNSGFA